ncbi:IclR family transcriptional regulator [Aliiroseovarius subalbicans]|uniref:IclR family transcriptional regulator n=1 Tax=Aliiroseovarius subalbicans TaxID=2925840 RepID=UPI001F5AE2CF|nr:IclR family transcriptional regulator [Aliiroseovarius subalbicans]MCI2400346.1 IclR family transcriptional regulator [Aliiroseovarius subalbicans]
MNTTVRSDGTVGKALEMLDLVAEFGRPVRFTDVLARSPHPKATSYRLLQTLTNQRMLDFDEQDGTYSLGARLMRLAHSAWKTASLAPIARPFIEVLAAEVGETVHLAQIDQGQVLFVDKLQATDRFETLAQAGKIAPAYCTGVGKAMLAFLAPKRLQLALRQQAFFQYTKATITDAGALTSELERIRETGIAYDREEHEDGIISIAAPILSTNGRVIGALSIATATTRHTLKGLDTFRAPLLETAEKIGTEATHWQFPA